MVASFDQARIPRIIFGAGKAKYIHAILSEYGSNVLLITGKQSFLQSEHWDRLSLHFEEARIRWSQEVIDKEPTPKMVDGCVSRYSQENIDAVLAIGGGSVLDAGKAVSAMLRMSGSVKEYLEGIGTKKPDGKKIPFVAVPTTAGTGSETTKNAVISEVGRDGYKRSLRHDNYVPDIALVDPELSLLCPKEVTAFSGMDAFTQLLESYVSTGATQFTDAIALDALVLVSRFLPRVVEHGADDLEARGAIAYAAMISGITLANAGLGVVHGFASSVGGHFDIPHGLICGTLMGPSNRITLEKLLEGNQPTEALSKYAAVGRLFTQKQGASEEYYAKVLVDVIDQWTYDFGISKLSDHGMRSQDIDWIAPITSNKNNPVKLDIESLGRILADRL